MALVVPAILATSREDAEKKLSLFSRIPSVSRIQIDVVDGRFAEPPSWPYVRPGEREELPLLKELLPRPERIEYELDVMTLHPEEEVEDWLSLGVSRIVFHAESALHLERSIRSIEARYVGDLKTCCVISFGIALNNETPLSLIEPYLDKVHFVQCMGIPRIGRQGQPFDPRVVQRVREFRERHPDIPVQVDGGISLETARRLVPLGVSRLVVGSALLGTRDPRELINALEALESPYGV